MVMAPAAPCPPSRTSTVWLFGGCRVSAVTRRVPSGDWLASRFIHFVATCWRTFGTLQFSAMANGATCALGPGLAWGPALVSLRPARCVCAWSVRSHPGPLWRWQCQSRFPAAGLRPVPSTPSPALLRAQASPRDARSGWRGGRSFPCSAATYLCLRGGGSIVCLFSGWIVCCFAVEFREFFTSRGVRLCQTRGLHTFPPVSFCGLSFQPPGRGFHRGGSKWGRGPLRRLSLFGTVLLVSGGGAAHPAFCLLLKGPKLCLRLHP